VRCTIYREIEKERTMPTGILYESHEFLSRGPTYSAASIVKAIASAAERKVIGDAESVEIEKREKALRRQYLHEWICNLLDR
jgi:hypothetical protein